MLRLKYCEDPEGVGGFCRKPRANVWSGDTKKVLSRGVKEVARLNVVMLRLSPCMKNNRRRLKTSRTSCGEAILTTELGVFTERPVNYII